MMFRLANSLPGCGKFDAMSEIGEEGARKMSAPSARVQPTRAVARGYRGALRH
jgi:hypothetical protein